MAVRLVPEPQPGACPVEASSYGRFGDAEGECSLFRRQILPSAEGENVLLDLRQRAQLRDHPSHLLLVGKVVNGVLSEVGFVARARQPRECRPMSPLLAPLVAHDVGSDAVEPGQFAINPRVQPCLCFATLRETRPRSDPQPTRDQPCAGSSSDRSAARARPTSAHDGRRLPTLVPTSKWCHHPLYVRTAYSVRGSFKGGILRRGGHVGIVGLSRSGVSRKLAQASVLAGANASTSPSGPTLG